MYKAFIDPKTDFNAWVAEVGNAIADALPSALYANQTVFLENTGMQISFPKSKANNKNDVVVYGQIFLSSNNASLDDVDALESELWYGDVEITVSEYDMESTGFTGRETAERLYGKDRFYGIDLWHSGEIISIESDPTSEEYVQEVIEESLAAWRHIRNQIGRIARKHRFSVAKES